MVTAQSQEGSAATSSSAHRCPDKATRRQPGQDWSQWPTYEAAVLGLRNHWCPLVWEHEIREKPRAVWA